VSTVILSTAALTIISHVLTTQLSVFADTQLRNLQITTAAYHFLTTFVVLLIASKPISSDLYSPLFTARRLPLPVVAPICTLFTLFLILNNLSLTLNPTSFFQLAKILTVPSVILFNYLFFHKSVSRYKLGVVAVACVGVGLASGAGVRSNPLGTIVAILAFTSTALYQIWIGRMLDRKVEGVEIGAPVLLMNQTGVSMCVLVCLVPFLDTMPNFGMFAWKMPQYRFPIRQTNILAATVPWSSIVAMILAGFAAALINLSQFLIIGSTSVLTFNIIGITKTVLILIMGWYVEGKVLGLLDVVGVTMAISGSFMYAQAKN